MATVLTERTLRLASESQKQIQLIVELDGISSIFGAEPIGVLARYGENNITYGQAGLVYGGIVEDENSKDFISLDGSSNNLSQQLLPDKGGVSSTSTLKVKLIDKNQELTQLISVGAGGSELLARKTKVYLGLVGAAHPEDNILILSGIVTTVDAGPGYVTITISHPEELKRREIYPKRGTQLDGAITDISTADITVDSTSGFLNEDTSEGFTTFVRIDDEIIQYTGTTSTTLTGISRGALNTTAAAHDDNADVETFYRLTGDAVDLALKLMISTSDQPWATGVEVEHFAQIDTSTPLANAIFFQGFNVQERHGLVIGDFVTTTGASNGANNVTSATITDFATSDLGSYIIVGLESLVLEGGTSATASFTSKYDTLPDGLAMNPEQVDVIEHERLDDLFSSSFASYDFYLKDTIIGQEFINQQIYFPSALFSVPRGGKSSVGMNLPPLKNADTTVLNEENVLSASRQFVSRSLQQNFYNAVVYKYNEAELDERFKRGDLTLSSDSTNRIPTKTKPFNVVSKGLRPSTETSLLITRNTRRILERFKFGSEKIKAKVQFAAGFNLDVSDVVTFGSFDLKLPDTSKGNRDFKPRLFEIVNKSLSLKSGEITLDLLDTGFSSDFRFGVISPSSQVGTGSTTTAIIIKNSYGNAGKSPLVVQEKDKWEEYIGENVIVRDESFTFSEEVTLVGFDSVNPFQMNVTPALSSPPSEDYVVEVPPYDDSDEEEDEVYKDQFVYGAKQAAITSGTSGTVFDIALADAAKVEAGGVVRVHNVDFTVDSGNNSNFRVASVVGTTITLETDLGFTPTTSEFVDILHFIDGDPADGYGYF